MSKRRKKTRKTIKETSTGGNKKFIDLRNMTVEKKKELVKKIDAGKVKGYHNVKINGKKWPRSNPDQSKGNNLDPKIKTHIKKK